MRVGRRLGVLKHCLYCGNSLTSRRFAYCNRLCSETARRGVLGRNSIDNCIVCNTKLTGAHQRYCNNTCKDTYRAKLIRKVVKGMVKADETLTSAQAYKDLDKDREKLEELIKSLPKKLYVRKAKQASVPDEFLTPRQKGWKEENQRAREWLDKMVKR